MKANELKKMREQMAIAFQNHEGYTRKIELSHGKQICISKSENGNFIVMLLKDGELVYDYDYTLPYDCYTFVRNVVKDDEGIND